MNYEILADIILYIHFCYFSFVIFGEVVILLGVKLKWKWIRNRKFRITHLIAIIIVVIEIIVGMTCPLTSLEYNLRVLAGHQGETQTLLSRIIQNLMFYDFPQIVFLIIYIIFGLIVLLSFIFIPINKKRNS